MKQLLLFIFLFWIAVTGFSQSPEKAIGIRGGVTSGIEYRVFAGELLSYRAILSTRHRGIQLTGLKEFHSPEVFDFSDDFEFIYGFGAHAGLESWNVYRHYYDGGVLIDDWYGERRSGPVVGLDALAGIEYTIPQVPLVVGLEAKPYFNLFGKNFFQLQPFDFALTVKYTF